MADVTRIGIGGVPVTYAFTVVYGDDPRYLPTPGDSPVYGVEAPHHALEGRRYMLSDGSVWEYRGLGAYDCDNWHRVNGWERVDAPRTDWVEAVNQRSSWRRREPVPAAAAMTFEQTDALLGRMRRALLALYGEPPRRKAEQLSLRFGA